MPISSAGSATCRFESNGRALRRWLTIALVAMTGSSLYFSHVRQLPWPAWMSVLCIWLVMMWRFDRQLSDRVRICLDMGEVALLDGVPVVVCRVDWRGPLAFVVFHGAQGKQCRVLWLGQAARRREFKLALLRQQATQARETMAP